MSSEFQIACDRAQSRIGKLGWDRLSAHERAEAIYFEIRAMDAEAVARGLEDAAAVVL